MTSYAYGAAGHVSEIVRYLNKNANLVSKVEFLGQDAQSGQWLVIVALNEVERTSYGTA